MDDANLKACRIHFLPPAHTLQCGSQCVPILLPAPGPKSAMRDPMYAIYCRVRLRPTDDERP
eukprot:12593162-Prorocentrum_lima.AAC.1